MVRTTLASHRVWTLLQPVAHGLPGDFSSEPEGEKVDEVHGCFYSFCGFYLWAGPATRAGNWACHPTIIAAGFAGAQTDFL